MSARAHEIAGAMRLWRQEERNAQRHQGGALAKQERNR